MSCVEALVPAVVRDLERRRAAGEQIVFTNGCFDLLHPGHVAGLHRARALGDCLVVGVNDDASVRRLKGVGRPVVPLEERLELLRALRFVDHAVAFAGEGPAALIRRVRPHVYVKGADWQHRTLPEASVAREVGCRVAFVRLHGKHSTTSLIARMRAVPLQQGPPGDSV